MQPDRYYWPHWAQFLQDKGARETIATLLEAAGPLRLLAAQLVYAGIPLVSAREQSQQWQALAGLLENQEETRSFISFLRKEENPVDNI